MTTDAQSSEVYQKGLADGQRAERLEIARKLLPHLPLPVIASVAGLTTKDLVQALDEDENVALESQCAKGDVSPVPMRKSSVRASRIVTPDVIPVSPQRAELHRKVRQLVNRVERAKRHGGSL